MMEPIPATQPSPVYQWRKMTDDDIERGVIIRLKNLMHDGSYAMATIIAVRERADIGLEGYVTVARPYAYATESYNTNQPLLGCEVFDIPFSKLLDDKSDVEVFQGNKYVRRMVTS